MDGYGDAPTIVSAPMHDFLWTCLAASCTSNTGRRTRVPVEGTAKGLPYREFERRRDGMVHAMDGGLWMHRHVWKGKPMAHLVSTDKAKLLEYGEVIGIPAARLQYKPLKDPRTGVRREAWHWDLGGPFLPSLIVKGDSDARRYA
jgi:hypothetical protein